MSIAFFIPHKGCRHRCSFCDQRAVSGQGEPVTAAEVSAALERAFLHPQPPGTEIAFFGGSFTCLPRTEMAAFLEAAYPFVAAGKAAGIRCSTRPDGIDGEVLAILKHYQVRAVELGAQSMDDRVLALNGRGHTAADVIQAAALIHSAGLELGVQMMVGLPGEQEGGAARTAERLIALKPATVRIYPALTLKGTRMAELFLAGQYQPLTLEEAVRQCAALMEIFKKAGVKVIRVGLQAERSLEGNLLAGPYHPAFRELCEGAAIQEAVDKALANFPEGAALTLWVNPKDRSRTAGHQKQNLRHWAGMRYAVAIREDRAAVPGSWRLEQQAASP